MQERGGRLAASEYIIVGIVLSLIFIQIITVKLKKYYYRAKLSEFVSATEDM